MLGLSPIHAGTMHPAAIMFQVFVLLIGMIVQQPDLVSHVEERNAAEAGDQRVSHENAMDGIVDRRGIVVFKCRFETAERGAGAVGSLVAGAGVRLEVAAPGEATREPPGIEIRQEISVGETGDTGCRRILIGYRPTDIVVAAEISTPCGIDEASITE